jgi:hypothetical protein
MSIRVIKNGKEVRNPFVRFFIGLLAVVIIALLGMVIVVVILPLIGAALVLSFGLGVVVIVLASLVSIRDALTAYQHRYKKQKRLKCAVLAPQWLKCLLRSHHMALQRSRP